MRVFCRRHGFVAQGLKATDEEIYAACERAQARELPLVRSLQLCISLITYAGLSPSSMPITPRSLWQRALQRGFGSCASGRLKSLSKSRRMGSTCRRARRATRSPVGRSSASRSHALYCENHRCCFLTRRRRRLIRPRRRKSKCAFTEHARSLGLPSNACDPLGFP